MYNCAICLRTTPANQPAKKITLFREIKQTVPQKFTHHTTGLPQTRYVERILLQIEKEILVCEVCHDGHRRGIPLNALRTMHRPMSNLPLSERVGPEHGDSPTPAAPPACASSTPSPKEEPPTLLLGASKAEKLIAAQEVRGSKRKPTKKIKHENLKKRRAKEKAKQP